MISMHNWKKLLGVALFATAGVSCGDVVRQGRGPMFLVIDSLTATKGGGSGSSGAGTTFLQSDVITNVTSPAPCTTTAPCPTVFNDTGTVSLRLSSKDVATAGVGNAPSGNNAVTINRYRVTYRRNDGHNTPGIDVPYGFDGAVTGTVQPSGTLSLGFELVRHIAKQESPLVQLVESSSADVSFWGRDQVGNDIGVTGSIQIDFANFGDR
jgi:hypothetical protein